MYQRTHGVSSSRRNGEPSVTQVYTRVPSMRAPSAANTALYTPMDPAAAAMDAPAGPPLRGRRGYIKLNYQKLTARRNGEAGEFVGGRTVRNSIEGKFPHRASGLEADTSWRRNRRRRRGHVGGMRLWESGGVEVGDPRSPAAATARLRRCRRRVDERDGFNGLVRLWAGSDWA